MASKSPKKKTNSSQSKQHSGTSKRLPFEPGKTAKKSPASAPQPERAQTKEAVTPASTAIPEVVSRRMLRRMALFCGLPTALGLLIFPVSYFNVTQHWVPLPHVLVVFASLGLMGLGAFGLTYGVLSSSWDEDREGNRLGWKEFKTNLGRLRSGWRAQREARNSK